MIPCQRPHEKDRKPRSSIEHDGDAGPAKQPGKDEQHNANSEFHGAMLRERHWFHDLSESSEQRRAALACEGAKPVAITVLTSLSDEDCQETYGADRRTVVRTWPATRASCW